MARLIDADALKQKTLAHGEKIAYVVSFLWDIDDSPAIDAIPVEWLEHMMTATTLARTSNAIKDVLGYWKRMGQKE